MKDRIEWDGTGRMEKRDCSGDNIRIDQMTGEREIERRLNLRRGGRKILRI